MKNVKLIFFLSLILCTHVFGNQQINYNINPCFTGDYREKYYFENHLKTDTYEEYYYIKNDYVPYDVDAVLIIDGNFVPREFPVIHDGVALVPIRIISEKLGGKVKWNSKLRKVTISRDNLYLEFFIDNNLAIINGEIATLEVSTKIIREKTYVPLRLIAEGFNEQVDFQKGKESIFPNIISINQKISDDNVKISKEKALEMVKNKFNDIDWGNFLTEHYVNVNDMPKFSIQKEKFGRFWVVDLDVEDNFSYVSIWVDVYSGNLYSRYGGYEGVFSLDEGIEGVESCIKIRLL